MSAHPPQLLKIFSMILTCVPSAAFSWQAGARASPFLKRARATKLFLHSCSKQQQQQQQAPASGARSPELIPLFYNDVYRVELPEGHRFPMEKYRLVREVSGHAPQAHPFLDFIMRSAAGAYGRLGRRQRF